MLGLETLKAFQKWKDESLDSNINRNTLIVGMSATAEAAEYHEAFGYGMDFFVQKPVQKALLTALIDEMLYFDNRSAIISGLKRKCEEKDYLREKIFWLNK